ncbi:mavicyanin-like [Lolium perenne]|uniref:mavicyanin-like n=1 Tax=Lolium perenne TaxID=4522 RepID=UPI0021F67AAC|nr:mavicyanin-like [Lolium perenne]
MAYRQVLLLAAAAIAAAILLAPASAEDFTVGDAAGWTLKYPAVWTDGKAFVVGDSLMFMYPSDKHNVMEVMGTDFKAYNVTGNALGTWNSGSDTVPLAKVGRRWFVCGVGNHCAQGMKFLVVTADSSAQAPAAPPSSSASFVSGAISQAMAAAGAVAAAALMF